MKAQCLYRSRDGQEYVLLVTTYIVYHEGCNGSANFIVGFCSPRRSKQYEQKSARKMEEEEEEEEEESKKEK